MDATEYSLKFQISTLECEWPKRDVWDVRRKTRIKQQFSYQLAWTEMDLSAYKFANAKRGEGGGGGNSERWFIGILRVTAFTWIFRFWLPFFPFSMHSHRLAQLFSAYTKTTHSYGNSYFYSMRSLSVHIISSFFIGIRGSINHHITSL